MRNNGGQMSYAQEMPFLVFEGEIDLLDKHTVEE